MCYAVHHRHCFNQQFPRCPPFPVLCCPWPISLPPLSLPCCNPPDPSHTCASPSLALPHTCAGPSSSSCTAVGVRAVSGSPPASSAVLAASLAQGPSRAARRPTAEASTARGAGSATGRGRAREEGVPSSECIATSGAISLGTKGFTDELGSERPHRDMSNHSVPGRNQFKKFRSEG